MGLSSFVRLGITSGKTSISAEYIFPERSRGTGITFMWPLFRHSTGSGLKGDEIGMLSEGNITGMAKELKVARRMATGLVFIGF